MGPASSAQREPSMEEILASIRRIIEDSDTARASSLPDTHPDTNKNAADDRAEGSVIEVDAFRAELRGKGEQPEPMRAEADVVVRPPASVTSAPQATKTATPAVRSAVDLDAGFDRAFQTIREATVAAERPAVSVAAAPAPAAPVAAESAAPAASVPAPVPATEATRPAIISEKTGRQVAASFGELTDAFAASRRKSFDEIAEEMLRPMLQDWLDNNLPTLVERLVREEIERIARGG